MNTQYHSNRVGKVNLAKQSRGTIGVLAGTATGVAGAINGTRDPRTGQRASRLSHRRCLSGLFSAVTGGTVGEVISDNDEYCNYQHRFTQPVPLAKKVPTNQSTENTHGH